MLVYSSKHDAESLFLGIYTQNGMTLNKAIVFIKWSDSGLDRAENCHSTQHRRGQGKPSLFSSYYIGKEVIKAVSGSGMCLLSARPKERGFR